MSNKIKAYRILNNFTQDDVAKILGRGIAAYKRKENNPELFTIGEGIKLAELFKTTLDDIFFDESVTLKVTRVI
jgi:DNA-binding XRE family transcriptional regulator